MTDAPRGDGWRATPDAPMRERNTFHLQAKARWLLEISAIAALPEALAQAQWRGLPLLPLGGGSNLLFAGDFEGVALAFAARAVGILEDGKEARVRAEAGMPWHDFVRWSLDAGFVGLENLSLIPGTVGACPIQNIGAYGAEVGERIETVEAYDRVEQRFVRIARDDCKFGYRDSIFKHDAQRYVIVAVEFRLPRNAPLKLNYAGIDEQLLAMGIEQPNARELSDAIIRIRQRKLPDPALVGNAGSFFKNPIVSLQLAQSLQMRDEKTPVFPGESADTRKLSAAWLIEHAGWKGFREGDAGVSPNHALVLVNYGEASGAQIMQLARRIAASVQQKFGVAIEPEPHVIGAAW